MAMVSTRQSSDENDDGSEFTLNSLGSEIIGQQTIDKRPVVQRTAALSSSGLDSDPTERWVSAT